MSRKWRQDLEIRTILRLSGQARRQGSEYRNGFPIDGLNGIPSHAGHLVLLNTYFSAIENAHFNYNLIEVTVLDTQARELLGWEKAFLPANRIREWLEKYCSMPQRKKHCLSALRKKKENQEMDNM
jgi:hypothetical protein